VIRNADRLDLTALSVACRDAVDRSRADQLTIDERAGASATVSNLGQHGITAGTPVINGPEALLVFVGAVEPRAVVRDGAVVVRSMMTLSVAFDHRVVDGDGGGCVRRDREDPARDDRTASGSSSRQAAKTWAPMQTSSANERSPSTSSANASIVSRCAAIRQNSTASARNMVSGSSGGFVP
jgi:hypothetical protein